MLDRELGLCTTILNYRLDTVGDVLGDGVGDVVGDGVWLMYSLC